MYLIGSKHSTYLLAAREGEQEIAEDFMNNYSDYVCFILGCVELSENQRDVFLDLLSVNYGNLENPFRLTNHPSLWDLFKIPLTDLEREYIHKRQKSYVDSFGAPYWGNRRYLDLPLTPTPYWVGAELFPVFFAEFNLSLEEEEEVFASGF